MAFLYLSGLKEIDTWKVDLPEISYLKLVMALIGRMNIPAYLWQVSWNINNFDIMLISTIRIGREEDVKISSLELRMCAL